jgi:hypothetical protein
VSDQDLRRINTAAKTWMTKLDSILSGDHQV